VAWPVGRTILGRPIPEPPLESRREPVLVGPAEDVRDAGGQQDRNGDDRERDQGDTRHELDQLVGLPPLLLWGLFQRFFHAPINAQPRYEWSPSSGWRRRCVSRAEGTDP